MAIGPSCIVFFVIQPNLVFESSKKTYTAFVSNLCFNEEVKIVDETDLSSRGFAQPLCSSPL